MNPEQLFQRYQELQRYVGWTEQDAERIRTIAPVLEPHLFPLIEDFYAELNQLAVSKPKSKLAGDQSPLTEGSTDTKGP